MLSGGWQAVDLIVDGLGFRAHQGHEAASRQHDVSHAEGETPPNPARRVIHSILVLREVLGLHPGRLVCPSNSVLGRGMPGPDLTQGLGFRV